MLSLCQLGLVSCWETGEGPVSSLSFGDMKQEEPQKEDTTTFENLPKPSKNFKELQGASRSLKEFNMFLDYGQLRWALPQLTVSSQDRGQVPKVLRPFPMQMDIRVIEQLDSGINAVSLTASLNIQRWDAYRRLSNWHYYFLVDRDIRCWSSVRLYQSLLYVF